MRVNINKASQHFICNYLPQSHNQKEFPGYENFLEMSLITKLFTEIGPGFHLKP